MQNKVGFGNFHSDLTTRQFDLMFEDLFLDIRREVMDAMYQGAEFVKTEAKDRAPVDMGKLQGSIDIWSLYDEWGDVNGFSVGVKDDECNYACIFDSTTRVKTNTGFKRICELKIGDLVLTQTGDHQPITAIYSFPAEEKPELVDIEIEWRRAKTHKLTVTIDHKILVYRDGRNMWLMAGELRENDLLYTPKKTAYNKGMAPVKTCVHCGKTYQNTMRKGQGKKYCSTECKNAAYKNGLNPHLGTKRSELSRDKMRIAAHRRFTERPETHPNRIMAQRGYLTSTEKMVAEWLTIRGVKFDREYRIGKHLADFYIPSTNTIIEADGAYWHKNQNTDIERDSEILAEMPDVRIIHLHFFDKRFSPSLNKNPIPNVYYVACNPGTKSFTDPETFDMKPIISIRKWTYIPNKRNSRKLYDITVANVHSFIANGIIVSNSYVEYGTRPHWMPIAPLILWAARHGMDEGAAYAIQKKIAERGTYPQPYLFMSLDYLEPVIDRLIENAIDAGILAAMEDDGLSTLREADSILQQDDKGLEEG
jgi:hypothetical protein